VRLDAIALPVVFTGTGGPAAAGRSDLPAIASAGGEAAAAAGSSLSRVDVVLRIGKNVGSVIVDMVQSPSGSGNWIPL
jgi:hypothetical protein